MTTAVFNEQKPLRASYKANPELANVTSRALTLGADASDPFHSQVEPNHGCGVVVPVGAHSAVGGPYDAPCPGDLLCAALAACQDSTIRIVANLLGVRLVSLQVRVTGQVDIRGALGMSPDVRVGFHSFACDVSIQAEEGTPPNLLRQLQVAAERACVVQQTLRTPPAITTTFDFS
jgi:uncharacterized OsmC-like protein